MEGCACLHHYGNSYDEEGRLNSVNPFTTKQNPVFECNRACKCSADCSNKVVQNGVKLKLTIFKTEGKGFGLKALHDIPKNTFICEYAGEVLTAETAKKRTKILSDKEEPNYYIFVLNEHLGTGEKVTTYIDPMFVGNVGRFINHSCEPNLFMVPVRINHSIPHLALFALRDIEVGEELSFDYSGSILTESENEGGAAGGQPVVSNGEIGEGAMAKKNTSNGEKDVVLKPCQCASKNCRGFLPYDSRLYST